MEVSCGKTADDMPKTLCYCKHLVDKSDEPKELGFGNTVCVMLEKNQLW